RGLEVQLQHAPGGPITTVVLDFSYQPIIEDDGRVSGIFVLGTDLTDQRELERHYEELSTIVSQSSKSMAIADKNGFVTYINDSGRLLHGLQSLVGLHARDLVADVDRHLYDDVITPALAAGGQWQGEVRLLAGGGGSFPAHHNAFVLRNKDGDVIGTAWISRNLTDDKAAQHERNELAERATEARRLADSRDRERLFLAESIPQQVWTASADGVVDYVNERTVEFFGVSPIEDLHNGFIDFIHEDDRAPMIAHWQRVMTEGSPFEATFRLRRHDGEWRWYLARAVPFRDEHGVVVKWFGTNTDIHDARLANEELQQRTEFEQQLIGIVSHDLRNPLNAIGLSSAALDTPAANLDDRRKAAVARIVSATQRATRLINDLLDFSQARSTGFIPVFPEKSSLRLLVKSVVEELAEANPKRQISVEHSGEELVLVDYDRLTQVVGNLVGNALQHSLEDGVVSVRSRVDGDAAVISVHNDGTIVADDIPRLFQPFQQGAGHGTRAARSVGLGLYIAAQLVQAHGGTIDVTSTIEAGTTFTVTLPRGDVKALSR
ncbi:MAG TPA: PAS domain-containing protein, partial [Myxococcota bacterium]